MNLLNSYVEPKDFDSGTCSAPASYIHARLADPYDETICRFNYEFNVITGRVNLHPLWDRIDKGPSSGRWEAVIDWNGAVTPAGSSPF